jgi:hypothetical protein
MMMNRHGFMKKSKQMLTLPLLALTLLLGGCFYPEEERVEPTVDLSAQIAPVQTAVDAYIIDKQKKPIIDGAEADVRLYETIDLRLLYPRYLQEYPENSFEKGGNSIFVLTSIDNMPRVKMIDLRFQDQVRETQSAVDKYYERKNEWPRGEQLSQPETIAGYEADGYLYKLDTTKLSLANDTIQSTFSQRQLNFVIDEQGQVTVDYLPDLAQFLELNPNDRKPGMDLTYVLPKHSLYAPYAANAYYVVGEGIEMVSP